MKHLKKFNIFINENNDTERESYKERIEKFMSKFPDNPKHWGHATDELADIHNSMAEMYNEFVDDGEIDDKRYIGHLGKSKTPLEYITKAKKGIRYLVDRLPVRLIRDHIINHYGWF